MYFVEESAEDQELRGRFLRYLSVALCHHKKKYQDKNHTLEVSEVSLEGTYKTVPAIAVSATNSLLPVDLENEGLIHAISCLSEREQYVLMARVLRENSFKDIAEALHMSYKGAAAIYYRAVNKVKRNMGATT